MSCRRRPRRAHADDAEPVRTPGTARAQECACDVPYVVVSVHRERPGPAALRMGQRHRVGAAFGSRRSSRAGSSIGRRSSVSSTTSRPTACSACTSRPRRSARASTWPSSCASSSTAPGSATGCSAGFLVNGVRFGDPRGFSLPQLEPEKVVAQPLELALEEKYRYTLLGTDTVDGTSDLRDRRRAGGPRGRAVHRARSGSTACRSARSGCSCSRAGDAAASSRRSRRRSTTWSPREGGRQFNLLRSITAQQLVSAAGRSLLVERTYCLLRLPDQQPGLRERREPRRWPPTCGCTATRTRACASCAARGIPAWSSPRRAGSGRCSEA